ncbi:MULTISPECIES: hemolysin XhlA family protein [unclassified Paenibacillus]|uniref:hemolysin XhlA family protein n=1 Tax=unclassified Paenibacillus TaxID=185978 RepID=UPI002155A625|nr:hemolysin XhlA family protein [Paenibacillus sp. F4]
MGDTELSEVNAVVEETTKALMGIQIQLARMEKTLESVPAMAATLEATRDLAREAMQSSKSAHHRLDKIEDGQKWLWRTISGSAIAVVIGAIVAVLKMGGV